MVSPVKVQILDKEFLVACPDEERADLLHSAGYLNRKMREIRDSGKVVGLERIAVMAALNITHELLQSRQAGAAGAYSEDLRHRLETLTRKLDAALAEEPSAEQQEKLL